MGALVGGRVRWRVKAAALVLEALLRRQFWPHRRVTGWGDEVTPSRDRTLSTPGNAACTTKPSRGPCGPGRALGSMIPIPWGCITLRVTGAPRLARIPPSNKNIILAAAPAWPWWLHPAEAAGRREVSGLLQAGGRAAP